MQRFIVVCTTLFCLRWASDMFWTHGAHIMVSETKPNRLILEKSPYLRQHAHNPVDWYPWGEEAFAKASAEDKPIFLSIGYSTCHWCHVMERESFEVDSIAGLMNRYFVNIKVDREERPDVDKVYMTALQAMGENGGWPMSMFLTPDRKPFYGGTYFPPESRYGRMGFPELLRRIHDVWDTQRDRVRESAEGLTALLRDIPARQQRSDSLDEGIRALCFEQAVQGYDAKFGGFGGGPKFPRPAVLMFLLRHYHATGDARALTMVEHTLRMMSNGGLYDHLGGGFHRYSVDGEWRVPHFEKMLYDQAQIVSALVDAYQVTHDEFYARIARETLSYVLRDMTDDEGAFYSAEDADSPLPDAPDEAGEGAFYVWTNKEIERSLGEDAKAFTFHYGVEETGNALNDPQHEFTGKNILYVARSMAETAAFVKRGEEDVARSLDRSRSILFDVRAQRPHPHRDDKILTAWNGLMISAFARAAQVLGSREYEHAAVRAAGAVLSRLYDEQSGTLLRRYRDGEAKFEAHLDDYAFFTQALLDLYETSFDPKHLALARKLTEKQLELFWDGATGGFFDTSGKDTSILVRMKELYEGAEPTGNAVAAMNLFRLSHLTGNIEWRKKAEMTVAACGELLTKAPFTMPLMVSAFTFSTGNVKQIVLAGEPGGEGMQRMLSELHARFRPNKVVRLVSGADLSHEMSAFTIPYTRAGGAATAYVCEDFVCRLPTSDIEVFRQLLGDDVSGE